MTRRATRITRYLLVVLIGMLISNPAAIRAFSASYPAEAAPEAASAPSNVFDPALTMIGVLGAGSLGLPGEPVLWVITVTNTSSTPGTALEITDLLRDELRVERALNERGTAAISGQLVTFTVPTLQPGESVTMRIETTVIQGPPSGVLTNQASLEATGPQGAITRRAIAEVYVPVGLPATGYPQVELPGDGEPAAWTVGLVALLTVVVTAFYVWRRGRQMV